MKKTLVILIVIIAIIIGCLFVFSNSKQENNNISNQEKVNKELNIENEEENELNQEVITNEIENTTIDEEETKENVVSSEVFEETPKTEKEKAIDIVKKDYGSSNNIEFSVEGIDGNGSYIVTVRDTKTTQALAFYTVNVTDKTFTKREMN